MDLVFYAITALLFGVNQVSATIKCSSVQQCVPLNSCPELNALISAPTSGAIGQINDTTCAYDGSTPMVCCDEPIEGPRFDSHPNAISNSTPGRSKRSSLLPAVCGYIGSGTRILGGEEVELGTYIWMALLNYGMKSNPNWGCAGSLITERYVVTAGHCVHTRYTSGKIIQWVRLGEHDISNLTDCKETLRGPVCANPVQDISPQDILIHPDFDKGVALSNDIALIRLDQPAQLNRYVWPICLPPSNLDIVNFLDGRKAEVAGWGNTEGGFRSNVKLMVEVPFVNLATCKHRFNSLEHPPSLLDKGQICFGGEVGKDSCNGDSGGPVVKEDIDRFSTTLYVLLGVVSYGTSKCGSDLPAVYTEVSQYRNWIIGRLRE